jgi:hypothetical protein
MNTNIIHPPSQLRRDVDTKPSGGLKRRVVSSHTRTTVLPPLRLSDSIEETTADAGCRSPALFYWKRDFDQFFGTAKPAKNTTTYVEWKKEPKKRKKKNRGDGSFTETPSLHRSHDDELPLVSSRIRSKGDHHKHDPNHHQSRNENSPPSSAPFKPSFSHSRYSNLQKFRSLSYHEKQKMSDSPSRSNKKGALSDLAAIKQDLADLKQWATSKKTKSKGGKKVQFAHPLISQLKYRPKTRPEEIDALFFREDELLDWEEDRVTTSPEFVELVITDDDGPSGALQVCDVP